MKLTAEESAIIRNTIEQFDCKVYEQYSGRGMYGRQCFGITVPRESGANIGTVLTTIILELVDAEWDVGPELWKMSYDSLGLDMIYYFPELQLAGEGEKDEEGE